MSVYRNVSCRIHASDDFRSLSAPPANAQTLFLYLLTCFENGPIPGVIRTGPMTVAEHHGWKIEDTEACFAELEDPERGMSEVDRSARLVWLPKAHLQDENQPANSNMIKSWSSVWALIPDCPLKLKIWETYSAWLDGSSTPTKQLGRAFREVCARPLGSTRVPGKSRLPNRSWNGSGNGSPTQDSRLKIQDLSGSEAVDAESRVREAQPPPPSFPDTARLFRVTREQWLAAELEPIPTWDDAERSAFYANFVRPRIDAGLTEKQIETDALLFVERVRGSSIAKQRSFHSIMAKPTELARVMSGDRKDWSRVERRPPPAEAVLSEPLKGGGESMRARARAIREVKQAQAGPVVDTTATLLEESRALVRKR